MAKAAGCARVRACALPCVPRGGIRWRGTHKQRKKVYDPDKPQLRTRGLRQRRGGAAKGKPMCSMQHRPPLRPSEGPKGADRLACCTRARRRSLARQDARHEPRGPPEGHFPPDIARKGLVTPISNAPRYKRLRRSRWRGRWRERPGRRKIPAKSCHASTKDKRVPRTNATSC